MTLAPEMAASAAGITLGEQVYLARSSRGLAAAAVTQLTYTILVGAFGGGWTVAVRFLGLGAAGRTLSEWLYRRRGPGIWTALAVVVAPYAALWLSWSFGAPSPPALLARWTHAALAPLALGAAASPQLLAKALLLCAAYVFCWGSGTFLTRSTLAGFFPQLEPAVGRPLAEVAAARGGEGPRGLDRAGRLIGDLERTLILSLAVFGSLGAVGFVIAAKSIARWDLARTHAEYFLIGTLSSIGVALLIGLAVRRALGAA